MARFFAALAALTALTCALSAYAPPARAEVSDPLAGLIRLQVIARSDSLADQAEKIRVRDRVRALAVSIVDGARDPDEAFARLRANRRALAELAAARVEIREVDCPLRAYGGLIVPAGRYRTVRVILGAGAGRNWWCVLYPDLCGADPLSVRALEDGAPVTFYSEIMRWARAMRGNES